MPLLCSLLRGFLFFIFCGLVGGFQGVEAGSFFCWLLSMGIGFLKEVSSSQYLFPFFLIYVLLFPIQKKEKKKKWKKCREKKMINSINQESNIYRFAQLMILTLHILIKKGEKSQEDSICFEEEEEMITHILLNCSSHYSVVADIFSIRAQWELYSLGRGAFLR